MGVPLAQEKMEGPATRVVCSGLQLDMEAGTSFFPEEKLEVIKDLIAPLLKCKKKNAS